MLTIGSLFSGIGGLELGLERAGLGPVKWQVERNANRRADLERGWPDAVRRDDVRTVGAHNLERVDLICGGFPCVEVSSCGRKGGLVGESALWGQFARVVGELAPRYVVVENSPLLARRGLDVVLADLASLGFDAVWFPLAARDVGAPHGRERLFIVGDASRVGRDARARLREEGSRRVGRQPQHADRAGLADPVRDGLQGLVQAGAASGAALGGGERLADTDGEGCDRLEARGIHAERPPRDDADRRHRFPPRRGDAQAWRAYTESGHAEPGLRRGVDGFSTQLDAPRIQALGNAVVPQVAEVVGWVVRGIHERSVTT